jgi:hypothetical protein
MKSILTFTLVILSLFSFSQNEAIKNYYQAHNEILEEFARTTDTARYLDNMYYFILENGKNYIRLTHHGRFLELCISQKKWSLGQLIITQSLNYDLYSHYHLKDTLVRNNGKLASFYKRKEVLALINNSEEQYKELMSKVNLYKSVQLNALHEIDQFGRTIVELEGIDTARSLYSDVIKYTDSTDLVKLYNYIEANGFPYLDEIGFFTDFIIMWHTYCRPCGHTYTLPNGQWYYDYLDSVYYQAVLDGNYRNTEYAYMKDKSFTYTLGVERYIDCQWKGQKYVTWYQGKFSGDLYDAKNIDKHRAEIYLPPYWVEAVLNGWEIPDDYPIPDNVKLRY